MSPIVWYRIGPTVAASANLNGHSLVKFVLQGNIYQSARTPYSIDILISKKKNRDQVQVLNRVNLKSRIKLVVNHCHMQF